MRLLPLTLRKSQKLFAKSYCPLYHLPFGTTRKCGKEQEEIALPRARGKSTVSKSAVTAATTVTAVTAATAATAADTPAVDSVRYGNL
ncbi:hypothetical protein M0802_003071 [Mischocyttarus mexicanus]|nr:hypothetical protein M0802_003071 [Mischocyttarus mexicanus]